MKIVVGSFCLFLMLLVVSFIEPKEIKVDSVTIKDTIVNSGIYLVSGDVAHFDNVGFSQSTKFLKRYKMVWEVTYNSGGYSVLVHDVQLGVGLPLNLGFKYYDTRSDKEIIKSRYDKLTYSEKALLSDMKYEEVFYRNWRW